MTSSHDVRSPCRRALLALGGGALLQGCARPLGLNAFAGREPVMDPFAFFAGRTRGEGVIQTPGGRPSRAFEVEGFGALRGDAFVLEQKIAYGDGEVAERAWRLERAGPKRFAGTLSDAAGPVTMRAAGDALRLRYRLAGPARVEQWLHLLGDGRSALNSGTVTALGVTLARIAERIEKVG